MDSSRPRIYELEYIVRAAFVTIVMICLVGQNIRAAELLAGPLVGHTRPHSKSLSSVRFKVLRHGRTSLWLAGFGFQAAGAADEQVLSGHRRGLLHNTHICRCLEAYSSRGAFFSELQSGQIQAACSSSSRRRFFISMMRQKL